MTSVDSVKHDAVRILSGVLWVVGVGGAGSRHVLGRRYVPIVDGCRASSSKASTINRRLPDRSHRANCKLNDAFWVIPIFWESVESITEPHCCNHTEGSPSLSVASASLDHIIEWTSVASCSSWGEHCPGGHTYVKVTFGISLESSE